MTDILDRTTHDRASAKDVADWCARSLAEAKETGAFDTRCFVQNADLIIAALRGYAGTSTTPLIAAVSAQALMLNAANDLLAMNLPMPLGISIMLDVNTNNILVSNFRLGFCITQKAVETGLHKAQFGPALEYLIKCLEDKSVKADIIRSSAELASA